MRLFVGKNGQPAGCDALGGLADPPQALPGFSNAPHVCARLGAPTRRATRTTAFFKPIAPNVTKLRKPPQAWPSAGSCWSLAALLSPWT